MKAQYKLALWLGTGLLLLVLLSLVSGRSGFMLPGALRGDTRSVELARLILVELRLPRTVLANGGRGPGIVRRRTAGAHAQSTG
jgi:hypothetical protein